MQMLETIYEFKQTRYISRKSVSGFKPGTDGFNLNTSLAQYRFTSLLGITAILKVADSEE
jgi:hypothetical protein